MIYGKLYLYWFSAVLRYNNPILPRGVKGAEAMQAASNMVRHAILMMAGTFLSRVLGLVREVVVAAFFGATRSMDAFNVAYTLANLARQLLAEGALSAAFVPVFSKALQKDRGHALRLARGAMTVLLLASSAVTLLGIWGAPFLTRVMAPGFAPETAALASSLTRWMFPFLILISLAALVMGELNSLGSFFVPALAPAFSNLAFILTAPPFAARWGVYGLALSVLCGGAAHLLTQWVWSARMGATLYPTRPDLRDPGLRKMMALFLPYAAGLSLNQVNPVVSRMLGSFLQEGSISVLNYSNRILQLPLGLFVIAISQAVLPQLSRAQDPEDFAATLRQALRFALFIVLPASLGLILISSPFVHQVFVRGEFNAWAWEATSSCLALGMLGLPGMACSTVVMRALYALSMPREAFKTTFFSVGATALLSLVLMFPLGYNGLALAPSIAFTLSGLLGLRYVRKKLARPLEIVSLSWAGDMLVAVMALDIVVRAYRFFLPYSPGAALPARAGWCLGIIAAGMAAYGTATWVLGFSEWGWIRQAFSKKAAQN